MNMMTITPPKCDKIRWLIYADNNNRANMIHYKDVAILKKARLDKWIYLTNSFTLQSAEKFCGIWNTGQYRHS